MEGFVWEDTSLVHVHGFEYLTYTNSRGRIATYAPSCSTPLQTNTPLSMIYS